MQFHLNGFTPGDPEAPAVEDHLVAPGNPEPLPETLDVLIVGCGPAGLTLAAQLAAFPDIRTGIVDQRPGRLLRGHADGIACRTMEMFHAYGFSERVLREAYWVNETAFWTPDARAPREIVRSGRVQDTEDGLSEFPHVILNQARVHDFFLDVMRRSPSGLTPHYDRRLTHLEVDTSAGPDGYPVTARLERLDGDDAGRTEVVRARYLVGCDGARSTVRTSIGRALHGDSANHAWGVMDVLVVSDFPDIRLKCLIKSAADGSVLIIPREGGYLVRLYIELDKLAVGERVANRAIKAEDLIEAARRILHSYTFDVKEIAWWSVYEIGQRLCDKFDDVPTGATEQRLPRVFIAGDACHTHSPKAGQGMNVSMQDGFNLGWKLASVLRKRSAPHLLHTYSAERQAIAKELIDFDREWAGMLASSASGGAAGDPAKTQRYFVEHGRYTAGTATVYRPSLLTAAASHQHLATGFAIGARFHSAPVIRLADVKPVELGHVVKADGRWRVFVFAGADEGVGPGSAGGIARAADALGSLVRVYTPAGHDADAIIDLRAVFQASPRELALGEMPPCFLPRKGRYGLIDYEKVFCADRRPGQDIYDLRGIDRAQGCMVVVRPDQYVAHVLPLDACGELATYFDAFMIRCEQTELAAHAA